MKIIPPKFKIQALPKKKQDGSYGQGVCVGYIDSRDCQDYLDEYHYNNRQCNFYEVKSKTFCSVGIKIEGERLRRSDSGALSDSSNVDNDVTSKGDTSDAFKRACVMWGIGRCLYSLPKLWITQEEYTKNQYKITEFIQQEYKKELEQRSASIEKQTSKEEPQKPEVKQKPKYTLQTHVNVIKLIAEGKAPTMEEIKSKYDVSESQEKNIQKKLMEAVKPIS